MAKKTNKTSHVMDLLTNGASSEPNTSPASSETPPTSEKKGDVQSHTVTPKKVTVVDEGSRNDRLSSEILNKLSEELEQEQETGQEANQETNQEIAQETQEVSESAETQAQQNEQIESMPQSEPDDQPNLPPEPEEIAEDIPLPPEVSEEEPPKESPEANEQPSHQESTPNPAKTPQMIIPPSHITDHLQIKEYHFVNVMERLIMRQNMDNFFTQYGVCRCERCVADVYALALTGLPSKYVVIKKDSLSPILSYYESKFKIYMLTEIIKACNQVRENPRHD